MVLQPSVCLNGAMPPVKKPSRQRRRHFIKEWRKYRGKTQEQAAEAIGIAPTTWGRIENNQVPYSQDFLEEASVLLNCDPWDLLNVDPYMSGAAISNIDQFRAQTPEDQAEALRYIEFHRRRGA